MMYNRSCLRKTLKQLTNSEFDESLDDFPDVREQFTRGMDRNDQINIILDYFEKKQQECPKFLEAIKKANPTAYEYYCSELKNHPVKVKINFVDELEQIFNKEYDDYFWECLKEVYQDFLLGLE